jgi:hypothetical protein
MKIISRIVATGVAVFAITAGSVIFSGTANATATQCVNYLQWLGYRVTDDMSSACWKGQYGMVKMCQNNLAALNIPAHQAAEACRRAYLP